VPGLRKSRARSRLITTAVACTLAGSSAFGACKPPHPLATIDLKTMGECAFDPLSMSYSGEPDEQAMCLMRGMDATRNLSPPLESLPAALESRVGKTSGLPTREALSGYLSKLDLEWDFAAHLWQPVSRANDDDPAYPMARYFVIHDTSGPGFGHRAFPSDIDTDPKINNLKNFVCEDGWGKAHVVVSRLGEMLLDHDFATPWRETKFERAINFAGALKGLFVHVEMIQPRRSAPGHSSRNDAQAPSPAFTAAQYDRLGLLYVIVSVREGKWLIPAFHAAIDNGIRDGHDDPMDFDLDSFGNSIDKVAGELRGAEAVQTAHQ
jgi:hypothetical protein